MQWEPVELSRLLGSVRGDRDRRVRPVLAEDVARRSVLSDGVIIVYDTHRFSLTLEADEAAQRSPGSHSYGFAIDSPEQVRRLRDHFVTTVSTSSRKKTSRLTSASSASTQRLTWSRLPGGPEPSSTESPP
jgi:hypothetical protein